MSGVRNWLLGNPQPACEAFREDLKYCLLESECVRKDGFTPKECLRSSNGAAFPSECTRFRMAFFECKRSLLDMRTRFRGRKGDIYQEESPDATTNS